MSLAKCPYWLTGAVLFGLLGLVVALALPESASNFATMQSYYAWFVVPAFFVFSAICIVFRIDFVSNSDDSAHLAILEITWGFSLVLVFFVFGALLGLVVGKIVRKKLQETD